MIYCRKTTLLFTPFTLTNLIQKGIYMNIRKKHFLRRVLTGVLCSAVLITQAVPVFATDEYGAPLVTATPTPDPHTAYYTQPADTDSIKGWAQW